MKKLLFMLMLMVILVCPAMAASLKQIQVNFVDEFGDSNINFWIWLYAVDRIGSFRVKSELIKRLHARFTREGITINYPVRLLTYEDSEAKKRPFPPETPPAG